MKLREHARALANIAKLEKPLFSVETSSLN